MWKTSNVNVTARGRAWTCFYFVNPNRMYPRHQRHPCCLPAVVVKLSCPCHDFSSDLRLHREPCGATPAHCGCARRSPCSRGCTSTIRCLICPDRGLRALWRHQEPPRTKPGPAPHTGTTGNGGVSLKICSKRF